MPRKLARIGLIERAGFVNTMRKKGHSRPVSLWRITNEAAALTWLEANATVQL